MDEVRLATGGFGRGGGHGIDLLGTGRGLAIPLLSGLGELDADLDNPSMNNGLGVEGKLLSLSSGIDPSTLCDHTRSDGNFS